jgi:asparagine synthase (glutamine-hydrolysing)
MPGILGIISKRSHNMNAEDLSIMVGNMMNEPFYTSGNYINRHLGLYVGGVCHKGSFSDCMPIVNENKDLILFYSGENFTDIDLIKRLRTNGHEFDESNASYLIHLYEENGIDFLQKLNGWFSGLLVDLRTGNVLLFNDRFGMQRIYCYESEDGF